ncbi:MAG: carbamoyl-phosphate-synthetase, partial [Clostridia bacterium]|nr:carbamoyl-phosphate-synthetase [Clostridia bacterium]
MKDFKGKKLMFLDGSPLAVPAVNRAKELGIYTIVANYYDKSVSVAKQYADEAWDINFSDIP